MLEEFVQLPYWVQPVCLKESQDCQIIFCYDDVIVILKDGKVLKMERVKGPIDKVRVGNILV